MSSPSSWHSGNPGISSLLNLSFVECISLCGIYCCTGSPPPSHPLPPPARGRPEHGLRQGGPHPLPGPPPGGADHLPPRPHPVRGALLLLSMMRRLGGHLSHTVGTATLTLRPPFIRDPNRRTPCEPLRQSFLVQGIETLEVNRDLRDRCEDGLKAAWAHGPEAALHCLLFVNTARPRLTRREGWGGGHWFIRGMRGGTDGRTHGFLHARRESPPSFEVDTNPKRCAVGESAEDALGEPQPVGVHSVRRRSSAHSAIVARFSKIARRVTPQTSRSS